MSKAEDWAKDLANTYIHSSARRPGVLDARPTFESSMGTRIAQVDNRGDMMLEHRGTVTQETAIRFARWILDTFGVAP